MKRAMKIFMIHRSLRKILSGKPEHLKDDKSECIKSELIMKNATLTICLVLASTVLLAQEISFSCSRKKIHKIRYIQELFPEKEYKEMRVESYEMTIGCDGYDLYSFRCQGPLLGPKFFKVINYHSTVNCLCYVSGIFLKKENTSSFQINEFFFVVKKENKRVK